MNSWIPKILTLVCWYRTEGVFGTLSHIKDEAFAKIVHRFQPLTIFAKRHLKCSKGFLIRLLNPLSANPGKWSNTCSLSVIDHFVGLVQRLRSETYLSLEFEIKYFLMAFVLSQSSLFPLSLPTTWIFQI